MSFLIAAGAKFFFFFIFFFYILNLWEVRFYSSNIYGFLDLDPPLDSIQDTFKSAERNDPTVTIKTHGALGAAALQHLLEYGRLVVNRIGPHAGLWRAL
jgi:hypothetical protein